MADVNGRIRAAVVKEPSNVLNLKTWQLRIELTNGTTGKGEKPPVYFDINL